jgi:hypothetical protein
MKNAFVPAVFAAIGMAAAPLSAEPVDCLELAIAVKNDIKAQPAEFLEVVEKQVAANEGCACEIVKAAIQAMDADEETVARIVEVAATTAPSKMSLVAQCAMAVAPDSLAAVQAVLAKIDPNRGGETVSDKGGLEKAPIAPPPVVPNPLDFPVGGTPPVIGPPEGGPPPLPPGLPPGEPPIIVPPVTNAGMSYYYYMMPRIPS